MPDNLFVNLNGRIVPAQDAPSSESDAFRLRYGVYETYLARKSVPEYSALHWTRLFDGLTVLGFRIPESFTADFLEGNIRETLAANLRSDLSRVRVQIFSDDLAAPFSVQFLIEVFPLSESMTLWLSNGIRVALLPDFSKLADAVANYKISHNQHFLPARKAIESGVADDMLLLNEEGNVIESAIANIFIVKDGQFITPPLSEGCLAGTIRALILDGLQKQGIPARECPLSVQDLLDADELFLCNGIRKIRWVREFQGRQYVCKETRRLYDLLFQ